MKESLQQWYQRTLKSLENTIEFQREYLLLTLEEMLCRKRLKIMATYCSWPPEGLYPPPRYDDVYYEALSKMTGAEDY